MSRDESVYSEPEKFNPDRFLAKPGVEPEPYFPSVFGFGRRSDSHLCHDTTSDLFLGYVLVDS